MYFSFYRKLGFGRTQLDVHQPAAVGVSKALIGVGWMLSLQLAWPTAWRGRTPLEQPVHNRRPEKQGNIGNSSKPRHINLRIL
jgi:hypothetical protein